MKRGFVLIELMVAMFIIIGALMASVSISHRVTTDTQLMTSRFTAAYLAQEGMEIVRGIRNSNWNDEDCWHDGLETGEYQADYRDTELQLYNGDNLRKDEEGFYNYGSGEKTPFKRRIETELRGDYLEVNTIVKWEERGKSYNIEIKEKLYNWKDLGSCD